MDGRWQSTDQQPNTDGLPLDMTPVVKSDMRILVLAFSVRIEELMNKEMEFCCDIWAMKLRLKPGCMNYTGRRQFKTGRVIAKYITLSLHHSTILAGSALTCLLFFDG